MKPSAPILSTDAPPAPAFAPQAFGKYYLVDRIAMGGMAEIFKAKTFGDGGFENLIVIKRILAHLSDNGQFVRMFMDEAKVSVLLQHGNIVRIYDFGKIRENYFIAMECVEGKDVKLILRKLAERRKILPREFAVFIAMEAAKGLDYAHKRTTLQGQPLAIVHRDVSPSNLLVSYAGEVKVADFGIVKAANCAEETDAGMLKGKFEYMSPEQASGAELDRRSDIFSLGIILHEMLTGRRLFKSDNEIKTLERIKAGDIDPPSAQNPQVPARLDEIVMRALARDADDRYQDARELHADLLEFLYPASPDLTQQSFAHFMAELFSAEVMEERSRMEEGTRLAVAMNESAHSVELEPEWEESGNSRSQPSMAARPASRLPLALAVAAFAMLAAASVAIAVLWPWADHTGTPGVPVPIAAPTTGSVQVRVEPVAAKVYLDDALVGEGTEVEIPVVTAGVEHRLRVEAEGHVAAVDTFTVTGGERVRMPLTLKPHPVVIPDRPQPSGGGARGAGAGAVATTGTAVSAFSSTPAGADVYIDGRSVGRTPVDWTGRSDTRVFVEYRLSGYESLKFNATLPGPGGKVSYDRALSERPAAVEGKVSVNVSGGWADVYVDGKKIGTTPITHALTSGVHEIRARNDGVGLDQTRKVTIKPGETASVPFELN